MSSSRVTNYVMHYLKMNGITAEQIERETGISAEKLSKGYKEPLDAEEFLMLCAHLGLEPEDITREIHSGEYE